MLHIPRELHAEAMYSYRTYSTVSTPQVSVTFVCTGTYQSFRYKTTRMRLHFVSSLESFLPYSRQNSFSFAIYDPVRRPPPASDPLGFKLELMFIVQST
jgi:hypothetical protein